MSRSSRRITVARHDLSCAVLAGGVCDCSPVVSVESYRRVCATCGGELRNRRRAWCSSSCRQESRIRGKAIAERQMRQSERLLRGPDP